MTMAVQQHALSGRHERQIKLSCVRLARQKFLEQERVTGDPGLILLGSEAFGPVRNPVQPLPHDRVEPR